ncbi:MAG: hypothetical protein PHQ66_02025 [Candidatus Nanoarchaeia archaeon]|nr:hypothetical protein [Candidatus Nanoarchaeia archaeon]MDD5357850.1 hypothetical protein [Candidatus Nanoarchaeia archaeon]MDD5588769.1 hypothetical protein [Candidatus Nanoarchaeia archaeon]
MTEEQTLPQIPTGKPKKLIKVIGIILAVTLATALLMMVIGNQMNANVIKERQESERYNEWLAENCECLEKERYFCKEGFEMRGTICANEAKKSITQRFIGCSKYDCLGEIKIWNNETEKWEVLS